MKTLTLKLFLISLVVSGLTACVSGGAGDKRDDAMRQAQDAFRAKDYAAARSHYLAVLKGDPDNTQALFHLGNIELYGGRPETALVYYQSVLELEPKFARAHYNMAVIHLMRAEDHFNFFAATVDSGRGIDRSLVKLLADIEAFADKPGPGGTNTPADPLDSLGELLGRDQSAK